VLFIVSDLASDRDIVRGPWHVGPTHNSMPNMINL
jgi:hypothetical protein